MRRISVAIALVVGLVAFGPLIGCASVSKLMVTTAASGNKGGPRTFVTVVKQDGVCQVSDGVGVLGGRKNSKITWYVSNYCDAGVYLAFTHYADPADPTKPLTDIVDPDPKNSPKLDPGDEDKKVEAKIIKDTGGTNKSYKYWICVSTSAIPNPLPDPLPASIKCLDPDVDIWP
jgi:hypothetical protein